MTITNTDFNDAQTAGHAPDLQGHLTIQSFDDCHNDSSNLMVARSKGNKTPHVVPTSHKLFKQDDNGASEIFNVSSIDN